MTQKNTNRTHRDHTHINRPTHTYKYVLAPPIMCTQQIPVVHQNE